MVTQVTSESFGREVLASDRPVVVDFYAGWCMPCRQLEPEIDALSEKWESRFRFAKVDVDRAPELAQEYEVLSIPTVLLFEEGKVKARTIGAKPGFHIEFDLGLEDLEVAEADQEAMEDDHGFECAC